MNWDINIYERQITIELLNKIDLTEQESKYLKVLLDNDPEFIHYLFKLIMNTNIFERQITIELLNKIDLTEQESKYLKVLLNNDPEFIHYLFKLIMDNQQK